MKKTIVVKLNVTDYLDTVFDTLPENAFINKGRCGIGGTTLEILAKRCSIIVVPTNGPLEGKSKEHPELYTVNGDKTVKMVQEYLGSSIEHKKIISTPDSFYKIILAAKKLEQLDWLYKTFFLLMDECHTVITEGWRAKILDPFKYFWNFNCKTLISATPYEFSDRRFKKLQYYKIKFIQSHIGKIKVVNAVNVPNCVDYYIKNRNEFPGELFFFYNSVTEIAEAIRRNNIMDCNIYCADKEENFEKLPENLLAFQCEPETGKYKKINFFTSKYFEGFDLKAKEATLFLVTDIHKAHTRVGISNKGIQAMGRIRNIPHQLIHITNHRNLNQMKTLNQFKKEYEVHTRALIAGYNSYVKKCNAAGIKPLESAATTILNFADIDQDTYLASYNPTRCDQVLNGMSCNEEFNNLEAILKAWEKGLYEVEVETFVGKSAESKSNKRKSKATILKENVLILDELERNKGAIVGSVNLQIKQVQLNCPSAFNAYYKIGIPELEELKYNQKVVEERLREIHNDEVEPQLLAYLSDKIIVGKNYTVDQIVKVLEFGYKLFSITNPKTGKIKTAYAKDIISNGWYKILMSKKDGVNIYIIEQAFFTVTKAA